MATKELPQVVLENNEFRIVAKSRTKQAPSVHAIHMVVDLKDSSLPEDRDCIDLFAEKKSIDSMGSQSWHACDFTVARDSILSSLIRDNMQAERKITQSTPSKNKS